MAARNKSQTSSWPSSWKEGRNLEDREITLDLTSAQRSWKEKTWGLRGRGKESCFLGKFLLGSLLLCFIF